MDEAHETLSGPATQKILYREFYEYRDEQLPDGWRGSRWRTFTICARAARTASGKSRYQKTRPTQVAIGERRRPDPQGRPGYLRVDTVHQGDLDGVKGVYHINAVDEVTQWQVVGATAQISEAWLMPVLEAMLAAVSVPHSRLPFRQRQRVHQSHGGQAAEQAAGGADQIAAAALQRQRPGGSQERSGDPQTHGLRAHRVAARGSDRSSFIERHFNPYLNFHRPCGVPEVRDQQQGKTEEGLPLVCHAMGDPAAVAGYGAATYGRA